jgi:hypothetical protein
MGDGYQRNALRRPPSDWAVHPKLPRGRPSKRTPELYESITLAVLSGCTLEGASRANGITYQTLNTWRKEDPAFAATIKGAVAIAETARLETIERAKARRKQEFAKTPPPHDNSDKAYYRKYGNELERILYSLREEGGRELLAAALARIEERDRRKANTKRSPAPQPDHPNPAA